MEIIPTPEEIPTKEVILKKLKEEGLSPQNSELVSRWLEDARKNETNGVDSARTQIELSDFYIAILDLDEAENCLSQAMYQAQQEGNEEVYFSAQSKLRDLDVDRTKTK